MSVETHGGNVWDSGAPEDWLDFSANLRPEGPPEWALRTMRDAVARARYYPDLKMRAARQGLAGYANVDEARILPMPGGAAAIDAALALCIARTRSAGRKGRVLISPPTFGEYASRAAVHGAETAVWSGTFHPGDVLVLCNPNNPTGSAMARESVLELHEKAVSAGAELLVDEAFVDFCPEISVRNRAGAGLTVAGSLTKSLCVPGVRLGYLCGAPETVREAERRMLPWSLGALASALAAALPDHLDELRADRLRNEARRERFARSLAEHGAHVLPSRANFLLAGFGRDMRGTVLRLRERHVLVRSCQSFGLGDAFLRLAVRTDEENALLVRLLWPEHEPKKK